MKRIPSNPYIVGNPIRTRDMFFGREDDFSYVEKKVGTAKTNQVLVFCGERRSGKTSILFQILGGRLGERFLPVLVDMQILAGIKDDDHFWRTILKVACDALHIPGITAENLDEGGSSRRVEELFDRLLCRVEEYHPEKIVLFLLDEYELIEEKIRDGSLSEATIHYLSGILESPHPISFIFTGSTNLEHRKVSFWKSLLGKSIYRKISYLSANDTARLITEPVRDWVTYPEELIDAVYRLTGGQPFYTQVVCQNLVDRLMEEDRLDPDGEDLKIVVRGIVDNPLPQMIYSWNSLSEGVKILLSSLAGVLGDSESWAGPNDLIRFFRENRLCLPCSREEMLIMLEEAYHSEYLEKHEGNIYRFRMDLPRLWIRREHSIWKVSEEVGIRLKKRAAPAVRAAAAAAGVMVIGLGLLFLWRMQGGPGFTRAGPAEHRGEPDIIGLVESDDAEEPLTAEETGDLEEPLTAERDKERLEEKPHAPPAGEGLPDIPPVSVAAVPSAPPAAPEARTAEAALLFITTTPVSASILLDGDDTGHLTPTLLDGLKPGSYTLELHLQGYRKESLDIELKGGETLRKEIVLAESIGQAVFDVRPTARIYLDGTFLLETPYVSPVQLRSGMYSVTIVNESLGIRRMRSLEVREGETVTLVEVLR